MLEAGNSKVFVMMVGLVVDEEVLIKLKDAEKELAGWLLELVCGVVILLTSIRSVGKYWFNKDSAIIYLLILPITLKVSEALFTNEL